VIFKRVGERRPYPDHGLTPRQWSEVPPRQVRLDELVTTAAGEPSLSSRARSCGRSWTATTGRWPG